MDEIRIRECNSIEELDSCIRLQREVFGLPDLEISPRRHLVVSKQAGGWTLGAFTADDRLAGFVHHLIAVREQNEIIGYSHMMAVEREFQNKGVGARLKWAQRERALNEGRRFIKWTWDPMQARNAHFNLNRLGVIVRNYAENFYGTDYGNDPQKNPETPGLDSDRLFAGWELSSVRVSAREGSALVNSVPNPVQTIEIPADWGRLVRQDPSAARSELSRVRSEFQKAFSSDLICAGFDRATQPPQYLLYNEHQLT